MEGEYQYTNLLNPSVIFLFFNFFFWLSVVKEFLCVPVPVFLIRGGFFPLSLSKARCLRGSQRDIERGRRSSSNSSNSLIKAETCVPQP